MSSQTQYCPFCGTQVTPGSTFCGNCGAAIESQPEKPVKIVSETTQSYSTTYGYQPAPTQPASGIGESETMGIIGLVLGALGCIGIIPIIGNIVAVILGHISVRKKQNPLGTFSLITGYLGLFLFVLVPAIVILIVWGTIWRY